MDFLLTLGGAGGCGCPASWESDHFSCHSVPEAGLSPITEASVAGMGLLPRPVLSKETEAQVPSLGVAASGFIFSLQLSRPCFHVAGPKAQKAVGCLGWHNGNSVVTGDTFLASPVFLASPEHSVEIPKLSQHPDEVCTATVPIW